MSAAGKAGLYTMQRIRLLRPEAFDEVFGLALQLFQARESRQGRGHDDLLSTRLLSALPGRKKVSHNHILEVEVGSALPADVGAPCTRDSIIPAPQSI